ncbi:hypothetical protein GGD38_003205 [Chitinophagaceae bacterium OAS944]|nr:hypothetical protein [Chitinophagaceae bacterium OAS944]
MLPAEIQYLLNNNDEDDINATITKADYSGHVPLLDFNIYGSDVEPQNWTLEVVGHRASEISFTSIVKDSTVLITNDHPYLWQ